MKIDEIDRKILESLVKDASISIPKLSKKIKENPSVCYSRIKRLVRRNLIKKFTIVVNEENLGYPMKAIVGLNTDIKLRENILGKIKNLPETRVIQEVTGRFDIMMEIRARSLDDLHKIVTGSIGQIEGVVRTETLIELKTVVQDPSFENR
ncbi:MAG TPA: Lrp/AsnC family transcriptional regulator [Nitrososphaerales archaeon]|mgnify:FL=1|jgi:Lrp/AsnC family transcriptional regulator for asnA, asnC and gidA|nr:Lrp/AsnC family transcriptional regulator [Nitrososphaerales archaeon]|tara:strand:- start:2404 stop:2856 length:453 start_codon:yes stop_codon:yes gene_type:complete